MRRVVVAAILCAWPALAMAQTAPDATPAPPMTAPPAATAPAAAPSATSKEMSPPDTWVPRSTAEVIVLDKLRAQPVTLTIKTGQSGTYGSLNIAVKGCDVRPPDLPQNATAFLEITDSRGSAPVFDGWILANTPSVSQFEHPVYDVRLAGCK